MTCSQLQLYILARCSTVFRLIANQTMFLRTPHYMGMSHSVNSLI